MAFNAVEIIALVFVIGGLFKIAFILINSKSWIKFIKGIYKNPKMLMMIEFVLAVIVFYYLLQQLNIIQIMAGIILGALLTGMTFSAYSKEIMPPMLKALKTNALKKAWILLLFWAVLFFWALGALFKLF